MAYILIPKNDNKPKKPYFLYFSYKNADEKRKWLHDKRGEDFIVSYRTDDILFTK